MDIVKIVQAHNSHQYTMKINLGHSNKLGMKIAIILSLNYICFILIWDLFSKLSILNEFFHVLYKHYLYYYIKPSNKIYEIFIYSVFQYNFEILDICTKISIQGATRPYDLPVQHNLCILGIIWDFYDKLCSFSILWIQKS